MGHDSVTVPKYAPAFASNESIEYHQDGRQKLTTATFYRGEHANFNPTDESFILDDAIQDYVLKGWTPDKPFICKSTPIVAFGSCFAANISNYLFERGYNILSKNQSKAYVSSMGDGIVNTFAIRQQFEWAWENRKPISELWHGFNAESFGYDDAIREATQSLFNAANLFVITLGLSEVWYDEPTGEVFWRAVPYDKYDHTRHKFRITTVGENLENLLSIYRLIRKNRPESSIVFTLSPIPLTATFRNVSCITANSVSKSILRVAIDEFMRLTQSIDRKIHYFPSYEIVTCLFQNSFMEDRKHPHKHVLDFNMKTFEYYYCNCNLTAKEVHETFEISRSLDKRVGEEGHFSVPRSMNPKAGGAVQSPLIR